MDLTTSGKRIARPILVVKAEEVKVTATSNSPVGLVLKRLRASMTIKKLECMDRWDLILTFNCCKRLCPSFGYVLSNRCRGISPMNLQSPFFQYIDDTFWGIDNVKVIVSDNSDQNDRDD